MNKISIYVLLILIFLGLSKSFSPSERKTPYLVNERVFNNFFKGAPVSVILLEDFSTGFLIKTYHHKYKVIHAFKSPEEITVRTSLEFWKKNKKNIGMSLFRRSERTEKHSTVPLPPGSLYIGDPSYGSWVLTNYGSKRWAFHRTYKNFPRMFNWKDFRPTIEFYQKMRIYESNERGFYGINNEFGTNGSLAGKKETSKKSKIEFKSLVRKAIKKYTTLPPWEIKK